MKKIFCVVFALVTFVMFTFGASSNAVENTPVYDATFNNNKGIFYANGNDIIIDIDSNSNTVIGWSGGSQIIPSTTTVVGGGTAGTTFDNSNITMNDGEVAVIYGGGISLDENNIAIVKDSKVTINDGKILATLYGGGLIYTKVENANVTVNGGSINALCGGGCASASIAGVSYSAGSETDLINSKNRVINANVIINGGTFDSIPSNYGTVFGGGQGYSYVKNANLTINDGDLSKAYVTSGGSNGYTKNAIVKINGSDINVFQSVNRGKIESAFIEVDGGNIVAAYVGGETDPSVTGIVEDVDLRIIKGSINNLYPGTSGGEEIVVEQEDYKLVYVDGTVENSEIGESETKITYAFEIIEDKVKVLKNNTAKINTTFETNPAGYEYLFVDKITKWESSDGRVVEEDEDGIIRGMENGKATVLANFVDASDTVLVEVVSAPVIAILILIVAIAILIFRIIIL